MLRKRCIDCHKEYDIKNLIYNNGLFLCQDCFTEDYSVCPNCGQLFFKRLGGTYYCKDCRELRVPIYEETLWYFPLDIIYDDLPLDQDTVRRIQAMIDFRPPVEYTIKDLDYTQVIRNPKLFLRAVRYYLSWVENTVVIKVLQEIETRLKKFVREEEIKCQPELV